MAAHHIPRTSNERTFPDTSDEDYDLIAAAAESQRKQEAKRQLMPTPSSSSGSQQRPVGSSGGSDTYSDRYPVTFLDTDDPAFRLIGSSRSTSSSPASTVVTSFSDDESSPNDPRRPHRPQLGQSPSPPPPHQGCPAASSSSAAISGDSSYSGLFPDNVSDAGSNGSQQQQQQTWPLPLDRSPNPYVVDLRDQSLESQTQALNRSMLLSGSR
ncbi:hypothetical protein DFQ26_000888 [Actinomortierella ambigua]|nr:hypothetical protein DFQ26_000888 [Actinomortierella ambigua]